MVMDIEDDPGHDPLVGLVILLIVLGAIALGLT